MPNFYPVTATGEFLLGNKFMLFLKHRILVMKGWPYIQAWEKTSETPVWRHVRPGYLLPNFDINQRIKELSSITDKNGQMYLPFFGEGYISKRKRAEIAWLRWCQLIPQNIIEVVSQYPSRHWHLLSLAARCGEPALDLMVSNPQIAYTLASNFCFHLPPVKKPMRSARTLLAQGKRQRDILGWLGYPPTESMRRIFKKLAIDSLTIPNLLTLKQVMQIPRAVKTLTHLERINTGVLKILADLNVINHASFFLLEQVAHTKKEDRYPGVFQKLRDTVETHIELNPEGPTLRAIRDLEDLDEEHDRQTNMLWCMENEQNFYSSAAHFPEPPFPGTSQIKPLTSFKELSYHGRSQMNCSASYARRIIRREYYLYSVTMGSDNYTLSLINNNGYWNLCELKAKKNAEPPVEIKYLVREWLDKSRCVSKCNA